MGAILPIVTRVGKEVDTLNGEDDFEGGLGVGGEPKSRVTKAIFLVALVAGWRGLFLGKKSSSIVNVIETSRRRAVAHHFYPRRTNSEVSLRKNDDGEDVNRVAGRFGVG